MIMLNLKKKSKGEGLGNMILKLAIEIMLQDKPCTWQGSDRYKVPNTTLGRKIIMMKRIDEL